MGEKYDPERSHEFSLQYLMDRSILAKIDKVQTISTNASKEFSLEKALEKMGNDWLGIEFRVLEYKDTGTFIVGGVDEVQAILDDQIVKVQVSSITRFPKN